MTHHATWLKPWHGDDQVASLERVDLVVDATFHRSPAEKFEPVARSGSARTACVR